MGSFQDLTGQISGALVAHEYLGNSKWRCVCQVCKNEVVITTDWFHKNIRLGREGCKHTKPISIGDTFGYLKVLAPANDYIKPKSKAHEKQWLCECICGRQKEVRLRWLGASSPDYRGRCNWQAVGGRCGLRAFLLCKRNRRAD